MMQIQVSEIKNIAEYELMRPEWRKRIMALKDRRRIHVGRHLTFLFENRETLLYQIQEMMRIERIVRETDILHEAETYSELLPRTGELSASLLIEYETPEQRDVKLRELRGLERHIWIATGNTAPVLAGFDDRQIATDRISAVQYVKWNLSPEHRALWPSGAKIVVDHPVYQAEHTFTPEQLKELAADFT